MAKFASIGELATGIIHEINNPIMCICSNVQILAGYLPLIATLARPGDRDQGDVDGNGRRSVGEAAELPLDIRQILQELLTSAEVVTSISRNLKSLAYSAHDEPKVTDLHSCIEAALCVAGHALKYRVRVDKDFGSLPRLVAYPGLLVQLFLNLFVNAAQAIEGKGVLRIRTRLDADDAIVEVSDTGRGVAREHLPKIFHPFFTTKPLGVGLGLGLSTCKRIIDRHGGTLEVTSSPGQGTMFAIRLPRVVQRKCQSFDVRQTFEVHGTRKLERSLPRNTGRRSHGA
jgi:signal transduction histidine kinase